MEIVTAIKQKRILVVEDDDNLNKLIAYNLAKNGYAVESVYDGISAKEKLSKDVFDVVVLDIMLPGIDGFRICEFIKENPEAYKTFVVVLTARAEPLDKIYGNIVGTDYYLTKPFSVAKLMDIIKELIIIRDKEFSVVTGGVHEKNS
jgi:two-component system alkaline phosphatase synthesis response regulator PhoP